MEKRTFSGRERLKKPREFQDMYKKGKRLTTRCFVFFYSQEGVGTESHLGITVTKNIGSAVERNRLKRQAREVFRHKKETFPACNIVIKARVGSGKTPNQEIRKDLERGFDRLSKKLESQDE